ncbi:hypothetical protein Trydic_g5828 [Trypoxylus dichotomus]
MPLIYRNKGFIHSNTLPQQPEGRASGYKKFSSRELECDLVKAANETPTKVEEDDTVPSSSSSQLRWSVIVLKTSRVFLAPPCANVSGSVVSAIRLFSRRAG